MMCTSLRHAGKATLCHAMQEVGGGRVFLDAEGVPLGMAGQNGGVSGLGKCGINGDNTQKPLNIIRSGKAEGIMRETFALTKA